MNQSHHGHEIIKIVLIYLIDPNFDLHRDGHVFHQKIHIDII